MKVLERHEIEQVSGGASIQDWYDALSACQSVALGFSVGAVLIGLTARYAPSRLPDTVRIVGPSVLGGAILVSVISNGNFPQGCASQIDWNSAPEIDFGGGYGGGGGAGPADPLRMMTE